MLLKQGDPETNFDLNESAALAQLASSYCRQINNHRIQ
jgi:hypothetical protein